MAPDNTAVGGTAFTVSIDVKGYDVSTGISAYDRAQTIKAAIDPNSYPEDFGRPGHIFPLRARTGGVLERRGQTEAAVDLASLAGLYPAGVICEIVNDDGSMARVPDLKKFCKKHGLVMITVAELARYRVDLDFEGAMGGFDGIYPSCPSLPKNLFIAGDRDVCRNYGVCGMIHTHSLGRAARYYPEQTALASGGRRSNFRELHDRVGRIAAAHEETRI